MCASPPSGAAPETNEKHRRPQGERRGGRNELGFRVCCMLTYRWHRPKHPYSPGSPRKSAGLRACRGALALVHTEARWLRRRAPKTSNTRLHTYKAFLLTVGVIVPALGSRQEGLVKDVAQGRPEVGRLDQGRVGQEEDHLRTHTYTHTC